MKVRNDFIYSGLFLFFYILSIVNMKNPLAFGGGTLSFFVYSSVIVCLCLFIVSCLGSDVFYISTIKRTLIFLFFITPSVFFSQFFYVSLLKFLPYFIGVLMLSFLSAKITLISDSKKEWLLNTIVSINRFVILTSIILFFLGLGFPRNETGFAGFFNHPQTFGVYLLFFLLFEFFKIEGQRFNFYSYGFIFTIFIMSYMTESRLSLGSSLVLLLFYLYFSGRVNFSKKVIATLSIIFTCTFMYESLINLSSDVLSKRGRAQSQGLEALSDSRMKFVEASFNNFADNPIVGIGFQVSNGKYGHFPMDLTPSSYFGLPLDASVEKGVFWSALIEETGIIGFFAFLSFLLLTLWLHKKPFSRLFFIGIVLIGMGESFFFSIGGVGFYVWVSLFFIIALEEPRKC